MGSPSGLVYRGSPAYTRLGGSISMRIGLPWSNEVDGISAPTLRLQADVVDRLRQGLAGCNWHHPRPTLRIRTTTAPHSGRAASRDLPLAIPGRHEFAHPPIMALRPGPPKHYHRRPRHLRVEQPRTSRRPRRSATLRSIAKCASRSTSERGPNAGTLSRIRGLASPSCAGALCSTIWAPAALKLDAVATGETSGAAGVVVALEQCGIDS